VNKGLEIAQTHYDTHQGIEEFRSIFFKKSSEMLCSDESQFIKMLHSKFRRSLFKVVHNKWIGRKEWYHLLLSLQNYFKVLCFFIFIVNIFLIKVRSLFHILHNSKFREINQPLHVLMQLFFSQKGHNRFWKYSYSLNSRDNLVVVNIG